MWSNPRSRLSWLSATALATWLLIGGCSAQDCAGLKPETTSSLEARDAAECSVAFTTPACQRIRPNPSMPVFTGTVLRVAESEGRMLLDGYCAKTSIQTVKVRVDKSYVGTTAGIVDIHAGDINGFYFLPRSRYLIYARPQPDGSFKVTSCGGTKVLKDAAADISYLEHWVSLPKTSSIFGTTFLDHPDNGRMVNLLATSLAFQKVTVRGPVLREVKTDHSGSFKLNDLPPGTYTVTTDPGSYTWANRSQTITVVERGCAKVDFVAMDSRTPTRSTPLAAPGAKR